MVHCVCLTCLKVMKNGPTAEEKLLNGENSGPKRNEDVLIKVCVLNHRTW